MIRKLPGGRLPSKKAGRFPGKEAPGNNEGERWISSAVQTGP
jgi:hypothetical protein